MKQIEHSITKNTVMLYLMTIAKIILPLVLLPYLTRVLSKEAYGVVSYVKAVMQYMQLFVDFGFMLSATKDIVLLRHDKTRLSQEVSEVLYARIILVVISFFILCITIDSFTVLSDNILFTLLSFIPVALSCFFMDFLFRGLEEMHILTIRFITMRGMSTLLSFFVIKSSSDLLWIPILEIIGSLFACALVYFELEKRMIYICRVNFTSAFIKIRESAVYFFSDMASTTFSILNTVLIGVYFTLEQIADWSVALQIVSGIQTLYSPIIGAIYPHMVRTKDLRIIKKCLYFVMPLIVIGCILLSLLSNNVLQIIGGVKYTSASPLVLSFIPLLLFSFPAMLFGWPCLGAINKQTETTITTIMTSIVQLSGMFILISYNYMKIEYIIILRNFTEFFLLAFRMYFVVKFKSLFVSGKQVK